MNGGAILVLGASGSVGSELCRKLVDDGQRVVAAGRSADRLEAAVGDLDVDQVIFDATDGATVEAAIAHAASASDAGLLGVVNSVGSLLLKPAHATTDEQWSDVIRVNLVRHFLRSSTALRP